MMDFNETGLMLSMLIGSIGTGYMIYGKKRPNPMAFVAGLVMIIYPCFMSDVLWELFVFACLMSLPFVIRI